ncbi:hypothetical protein QYF50_04770 [Paenibacillus vini]|nr:hypothetical protein [Paenibacillus vini]MDN4067203.1 hypothetical protein [Paenibacillus vini]
MKKVYAREDKNNREQQRKPPDKPTRGCAQSKIAPAQPLIILIFNQIKNC